MKIEERLERVRSILEKNNMLEGLQVFSDKQLDEAEEKFNFTFPEELRWVLKIIGVGGNNPLDEYHICNPHEPFNGLYFRRCDYLDFTRGEDLNGGFLFQINTGSYGPFYVMVLNGDLRGCIFDYNEELINNLNIAWSTSDKNVISNRGVVKQGAEDIDVILKATINFNGVTKSKEFKFNFTLFLQCGEIEKITSPSQLV